MRLRRPVLSCAVMENLCETCRTPDVSTACQLCEKQLCEDCVLAPPNGTFSLQEKVDPELVHSVYCRFCYDEKVEPEVLRYDENKAKAENVYIFFTTQRKEIPLIKHSKLTVKVQNCADRDETILRLAFIAAEKGFNAVIDTEVVYAKKRDHAYQTTAWSGHGSPAAVDEEKLDRQVKRNAMYR
ncbi:MAG: hypothetical protein H7301_00020 [Cryobacterium sp.]|nr:hypothetical protein [Oligoflexia bacterium]